MFTSTILKLLYSINILENNDSDYIRIAEIVLAALVEAEHLGSFLINLFSYMKFIPEWFLL